MTDPTSAPPTRASARDRWRRLAARAAASQSNILLFLLYFLVLVPMALIRRPFSDPLRRKRPPEWLRSEHRPFDLPSGRRQF